MALPENDYTRKRYGSKESKAYLLNEKNLTGHRNKMNHQDRPYIESDGTIVIPFSIDQKYQYWTGGQTLAVTLQELNVPKDIWHQYSEKPYPGNAA
ncbi:MAG: hypothetical protein ABFD76_17175 [Smithella sp.]